MKYLYWFLYLFFFGLSLIINFIIFLLSFIQQPLESVKNYYNVLKKKR